MATLNQIIEEYHDIEHRLIEAGGEITDEIRALLDENAEDLENKVDNYENFRRYLVGQVDYLKGQEARFYQRRKSLETTVKWLKSSVLNTMEIMGKSKLKTAEYTYSMRENESWKVDESLMTAKEKNSLVKQGFADYSFKPHIRTIREWLKDKGGQLPAFVRVEKKRTVTVR